MSTPTATRPAIRSAGAPFATPRRFTALVIALAGAVVVVVTLSVAVGTVPIAPDAVWSSIWSHLTGGAGAGGGGGGASAAAAATDQIVWSVRLPRTVLGVLVGAALAVAGTVIQAVVRNPLGDPYLIGIVPGAGLGAVIVIVLGSAALGGLSLTAAAFAGAMVAFAATFALGRQQGRWPATRLVLAGVAVGYLVSAVTYFLQTLATPGQLQRILFWTLGSVSGATWDDLPVLAVIVTAGTIWLVAVGRRLNVLAGGPELAASLGIDVGLFQLQLMALVALMTGAVVAVAGGIGFVGLMLPHLARLLVGADHRRVLIVSLLGGAVFLPLADIVARTLVPPTEIPIGIVTAAIGAPFFIWLLARLGRRGAGS